MSEFRKSGGGGSNRGNRDFKKRDFGRPSFGRSGGRDRDGGSAQMFSAVCAECHEKCEVPFRPNNSKPVYCNNCFSSKREGSSHDYPKRDFSPAPRNNQFEERQPSDFKKQFDALHTKLDKLIGIMEKNFAPATPMQQIEHIEEKIKKVLANPKRDEKKAKKTEKKKAKKTL